MDKATLQHRLQVADALVQRGEEAIAFQRQTIATLEGGGHDVEAAKMFLRLLEAKHAGHVAGRDLLFKRLGNTF
jgi:hypothetical protein